MEIQDYLNLITSAWQQSPNFNAMISLDVSLPVQVQALLMSMNPIFDLSTPPVGNQLDIIGQWVGVSRNIPVPINSSGIYFSWDDVPLDGWDYGSWAPEDAPTQITVLPDSAYLNLILGKIAANNWDGTTNGAYAIWDRVFPQFQILIQDYQNMSYAMAIVGGVVDSLTLALITNGLIPLRPEGIKITAYFVPVDTNPAFGWDVENATVQGWDQGSWLRQVAPT